MSPDPPLAAGRLQIIDDEHLTFRLKTPWSDGTCFLVLSPLELIEKLAALVPPPRLNLIRYHGVLAPNARDRKHIVPDAPLTDEPSIRPTAVDTPQARAQRLSWAALLARVFDLYISVCTACGGRMRIIATLTEAASIRRYLEGVGLPAEPPLIAPSPATPAATQPRLRRLKNSTAHPPGIDHRRHDGELRSKITPPTLQDPFPLHPRP